MENGDRKVVSLDDGRAFEVAGVRIPGVAFSTTALVVNPEIQALASALVPSAKALLSAKESRLASLRQAGQSTSPDDEKVYEEAEGSMRQAAAQFAALAMLSAGIASDDRRIVTVGDWLEILSSFKQDLSAGCIDQTKG